MVFTNESRIERSAIHFVIVRMVGSEIETTENTIVEGKRSHIERDEHSKITVILSSSKSFAYTIGLPIINSDIKCKSIDTGCLCFLDLASKKF